MRIPKILRSQFKCEYSDVSTDKQLQHSVFLLKLISIVYGLNVDQLILGVTKSPFDDYQPNEKQEFSWLKTAISGIKLLENMSNCAYPSEMGSKWHNQWSLKKDAALVEWYEKEEDSWRGVQSTAYVWGSGRHGELGSFTSVGRHTSAPRHLPAFDNMQSIALGLNCSFLCSAAGGVYSLGEGSYGRLGHGNSDDLTSAALISALQGTVYF